MQIDSTHTPALSYLGELYLEENNTKKAAEYFDKALKNKPEDFVALMGLAHVMIRKKEYE